MKDTLPLQAVELRQAGQGFPFDLPLFANFTRLELRAPVTFFVGENGCGKSTLLEILAAALRLPSLAQGAIDQHPLMVHARSAAGAFRLVRSGRGRRGFYFRADDVTGFLQSVHRQMREHESIAEELATTIKGDWGRDRAVAMAEAQGRALQARYGADPFARSHGELFLDLFKARITAPGIYLLDEPETPLSPTNQLALIALLLEAVEAGSQFIIVTHSPILMALPGAELLDLEQSPPASCAWETLEHVKLMREFLSAPERFLRHLTKPGD